MADYKGTQAYKFELFEPARAPKQAPKRQDLGPQKLVRQKPKSKNQAKEEKRLGLIRITRILIAAIIFVGLGGSVVLSRLQLSTLEADTQTAQKVLSEHVSEEVRLKSEISQRMSMSEIENYAINNLNMVKRNRTQMIYIDLSTADSLVYFSDKNTLNANNE